MNVYNSFIFGRELSTDCQLYMLYSGKLPEVTLCDPIRQVTPRSSKTSSSQGLFKSAFNFYIAAKAERPENIYIL